jgi:hypothetical protein
VERLNNRAQWIVLMGLLVSIALIFLAIVINESSLVGQTTAESVLDFPKTDIKDLRSEIIEWQDYNLMGGVEGAGIRQDIINLTLNRKNAVVNFSIDADGEILTIHYNNGVTKYDETVKVK